MTSSRQAGQLPPAALLGLTNSDNVVLGPILGPGAIA